MNLLFKSAAAAVSGGGPRLHLDASRYAIGGNLPRGVSFTRASSGATVQTSSSTMISGIAANLLRVGNRWGSKAILIECSRKNEVDDPRDLATQPFAGLGYVGSTTAIARPDGTIGAKRAKLDSGGHTPAWGGDLIDGDPYVASVWMRQYLEEIATAGQLHAQAVGVGIAPGYRSALTMEWERVETAAIFAAAGLTNYVIPCDASSLVAYGGGPASAMELLLDWWQLERGLYRTSACIGTRAGDELIVPPSSIIGDGRLELYLAVRPLGTPAQYIEANGSIMLWERAIAEPDVYAYIDGTTRDIWIVNGAGSVQLAGAPDWAAGDLVELVLQAGGGVATTAHVRINGGTPVALTGASLAAMPSGDEYALLWSPFFSGGQFSGFYEKIYSAVPEWAA